MHASFRFAAPPQTARATPRTQGARALRCAVAALVLISLGGCAQWRTMSASVTSSVSQTVSGWTSWWGGKPAPQATAAVATPALVAPAALKATNSTERWLGLYHYDPAGSEFAECRTGQKLPVLVGGDNALLESAYVSTRPEGGATTMLATVEGRLVDQPSEDPVLARQGQTKLVLRVERFVALSSTSSCVTGRSW